jgi:Nucleotidyl transferase
VPSKANDFGGEIIPWAANDGYKVQAYLFNDYWEDIGTIKSFFEANLALAAQVAIHPWLMSSSCLSSAAALLLDACSMSLAALGFEYFDPSPCSLHGSSFMTRTRRSTPRRASCRQQRSCRAKCLMPSSAMARTWRSALWRMQSWACARALARASQSGCPAFSCRYSILEFGSHGTLSSHVPSATCACRCDNIHELFHAILAGWLQDAMIMGADYYESDKQQEGLRAAG